MIPRDCIVIILLIFFKIIKLSIKNKYKSLPVKKKSIKLQPNSKCVKDVNLNYQMKMTTIKVMMLTQEKILFYVKNAFKINKKIRNNLLKLMHQR